MIHQTRGHSNSPKTQRTRPQRTSSKYPHRQHHQHRQSHPHHQYPHHHHQHPHFAHQSFPFNNNSSSSSSSSLSDSPHIGRHVTTVTATARVSIVHGAACTVLADDPRYQKRRRRRGEDAVARETKEGDVKLECIEAEDEEQRMKKMEIGEDAGSDTHRDSTV